jgi:hypothetical protein
MRLPNSQRAAMRGYGPVPKVTFALALVAFGAMVQSVACRPAMLVCDGAGSCGQAAWCVAGRCVPAENLDGGMDAGPDAADASSKRADAGQVEAGSLEALFRSNKPPEATLAPLQGQTDRLVFALRPLLMRTQGPPPPGPGVLLSSRTPLLLTAVTRGLGKPVEAFVLLGEQDPKLEPTEAMILRAKVRCGGEWSPDGPRFTVHRGQTALVRLPLDLRTLHGASGACEVSIEASGGEFRVSSNIELEAYVPR